MSKEGSIAVKRTVHKLQTYLLEGIKNEEQLFAAGSIISRSDYEDVVTERSIAKLCGYPLCSNSLPSVPSHKGRYRISLKEHKVYDLQETYMYCSPSCIVNSRAFGKSLPEERCSVRNPSQLNEILRMFDDLSIDSEGLEEKGDLGLSNLKIQEKLETNASVVPLEEWLGPSNAIEGYVPQRDRHSMTSPSKPFREGSTSTSTRQSHKNDTFFSDLDFSSSIIITNDEYSISKEPSGSARTTTNTASQAQKGKESQGLKAKSSSPGKHDSVKTSRKPKGGKSKKVGKNKIGGQDASSPSKPNAKAKESDVKRAAANSSENALKPSLKSSDAKKSTRSVTWADDKVDNGGGRSLCDIRELKAEEHPEIASQMTVGDDDRTFHVESAEACALALTEAAAAVASGECDASDAIAEAGVTILPCPPDLEGGELTGNVDTVEKDSVSPKWPLKTKTSDSELFDSEDSWFDAPPEGFSLALSPFATMYMALFAWVTSSSLAYIYGSDESSHEDFLYVNGREYPRKVVVPDGRSSEIKLTVEGFLGRTFPGLVAELGLRIPVSSLEKEAASLLETMSFVDAVPAFRMKQWQVFGFLFVEALSVCRIPALTSYLTSRRAVLNQVLDGARISSEEYEVMKDLIMPLGRAPQARSGA